MDNSRMPIYQEPGENSQAEDVPVERIRNRLANASFTLAGANLDDELEMPVGRGSSRLRKTNVLPIPYEDLEASVRCGSALRNTAKFLPIRPEETLNVTQAGAPSFAIPLAQRKSMVGHSMYRSNMELDPPQAVPYLSEYMVTNQTPEFVSSVGNAECHYVPHHDAQSQHKSPMVVDIASSESDLESVWVGNTNTGPQNPASFETYMNFPPLSQHYAAAPTQSENTDQLPNSVHMTREPLGSEIFYSDDEEDCGEESFGPNLVMLNNMKGPESCQILTTPVLVTRPKHVLNKKGTTGRQMRLQSNHFKLCAAQDWQVYQYQVVFDPHKEPASLRKKVMKAHRSSLGSFIYDGTLLYSSKQLNSNPMILASTRRGEHVAITITLDGQLNPQDSKYMRLFNALVRKCLSSLKMQLLGINYYDPSAKTTLSVDRLNNWDLWPGFMLSVRQHEQDVLLCAEITHKVMRNETVLDLLKSLQSSTENALRNTVKGLEVLTDYNNRTYYIADIDMETTPQSTFVMKDGRTLSYAAYYQEKYNRRVCANSQPMLISFFKSRADESIQIVYLVPELCRIIGLNQDWMKHDMYLFRALAERTNFTPTNHIRTVQDFIKRIISETQTCDVLKGWNMELKAEMIQFEGRVLPAEKILLGPGSGGKRSVVDFDWTPELYSATFLSSVVLSSWNVLVPNEMTKDAASFVRSVQKVAKDMGMTIQEPQVNHMVDDSVGSYTKELNKILSQQKKPQLVLCFLRNRSEERYNFIKKKCCLENAVATQVVIRKSIMDHWEKPITRRLVIQMNCKIGGAPWSVDIPLKGLMVIGIEVCRDSFNKGSWYCALVASINGTFSRFVSVAAPYRTNEERSKALADLFAKALLKYSEHNDNKLPSYIVVYRDGVGKRELPFVFENEVDQFKAVLGRTYGDQLWRLAYVLVAKHSNTRIFSANGYNPPPGTVVDDCITRPERYDFFMVTGQMFRKSETAFPTLYNVLFDNTGLNADKLQRLTYKLTHLYYNVKGMIRIPAPVRYAQRLVQMVALHLHRAPHPDLSELLYYL